MLVQMGLLQEFLITFRAFKGKGQTMRFHVSVQLRLLFKGFFRTARTIVPGYAGVCLQMLIERRDLRKFLRALIATVLLNFMVGLHMIIEICNLSKRTTAFRFDAYERSFTRVQTTMII